jgi:hypothetical protein
MDIFNQLKSGRFHGLADVQAIIDEACSSLAVPTTHPRHHEFFYEIVPIHTVAACLSSPKVAYFPRSHPIDGEIELSNSNTMQIECTRAVDGYQESLRMKHMAKHGYAVALQPVRATGTENKRDIEEQPWEFRERTLVLSELEAKLHEAFNRKNLKTESATAIALLITFDDVSLLPKDSDKYRFLDPIEMFWQRAKNECRFSRVFVTGDSRKIVWDSYRPRKLSQRSSERETAFIC